MSTANITLNFSREFWKYFEEIFYQKADIFKLFMIKCGLFTSCSSHFRKINLDRSMNKVSDQRRLQFIPGDHVTTNSKDIYSSRIEITWMIITFINSVVIFCLRILNWLHKVCFCGCTIFTHRYWYFCCFIPYVQVIVWYSLQNIILSILHREISDRVLNSKLFILIGIQIIVVSVLTHASFD